MNYYNKYLEAQKENYFIALQEIKNGKKETHWMWYVFPQIKGLGFSKMSVHYGIKDLNEAEAYFKHPILGERLVKISNELLKINHDDIDKVFYYPDNLKLHSCMTLFCKITGPDSVFDYVLGKFFNGEFDKKTLEIIETE